MAKASSWQSQTLNLVQQAVLPFLDRQHLRRKLSRSKPARLKGFEGPGAWFGVVGIASALLLWNWQLFLATGTGVLMMLVVFLIQEQDWQRFSSTLASWFSGANRKLALAVGTGGIATLSTYIAVAVWLASPSHWIAVGSILQGLGTFAILVLLVWQTIHRYAHKDEDHLNQIITELTDVDPLKRLIAVRQLNRSIQNSQDKPHKRMIDDYFRLMLARESEAIVRNAILDGLQLVENSRQLNPAASSIAISKFVQRAK
ncbi:MAG TPA: hypothetical protein V6D03_02750, partial [Candidatus Caenarcaniphilales bacterium]